MENILKINERQSNKADLLLNGIKIGNLDNDHNRVQLDFTERDFERQFGKIAADKLSDMIAGYYGEYEVDEDDIWFSIKYTAQYSINFAEEAEWIIFDSEDLKDLLEEFDFESSEEYKRIVDNLEIEYPISSVDVVAQIKSLR